MTAYTNLSDVVNRSTGGNSGTPETYFYFWDNRVGAAAATAPVAGRFTSLWQYNLMPGGAGAMPGGSARNPTRATQGALALANPGGGRQKWINCSAFAANAAGSILFYDRLADMSGFSGTNVGTQNTTSLAVTRYTGTSAAGNEIWVEIPTIIGTSGVTITATYTNQAGTGSRTTVATAIGATGLREAQRMIPLPLQAGDTGARSVQSFILSGTTGTAGDICIVIMRPLFLMCHNVAAAGVIRDFIAGQPNPPEFITDTCLTGVWLASTTTVPQVFGQISSAEA